MKTVVIAYLLAFVSTNFVHANRIEVETLEIESDTHYGHEPLSRINKGKVCVGTPPDQCFTVMLDTGSADFWLFSTRCEGDLCDDLKHKYDRSKSSTYEAPETDEKSTIKYGTGKINIFYAKESAMFGNIEVADQDFGEARNADKQIMRAKLDGVLGLAYKKLAHNKKTPLFYNMYAQQHKINPDFQNLFTFCKPSGHPSKGELILGSTASDNYDPSQLVYTEVTEPIWWKFNFTSITASGGENKKETVICTECEAVADSGTTVIRGHKDDIEKINNILGATSAGHGRYKVDCSTKDSLPTLSFGIKGKKIDLTPQQYILEKHGVCLTAFAVTHTNKHFLIMGGSFLDGLCTIYDIGNQRLGFVKMNDKTEDYYE